MCGHGTEDCGLLMGLNMSDWWLDFFSNLDDPVILYFLHKWSQITKWNTNF